MISATGAAEWTLGRPFAPDDPATVYLLSGPRVQQVRLDQLNGRLSGELVERGLRRMVVSRAEIGGHPVGSLHAFYSDGEDEPDAEQHGVVAYLASCIAHMYGDQTGLPVHGDGPVVAALADGLAVVDRDGRVRLWNPAAAQVTGQAAAQALSRPLPFPIPPPGQVLDHRLPDGRWLRITSGELPGPGSLRVVTFRDITDQQRRDHERDLFVAVTSHELRTPVTVIKGYADTLTDHWESLTDADRRQAARIIGQRANELARLVDRLLSSAAESGPGDEPPTPSTSATPCAPPSPTFRRNCAAGSPSTCPSTCPRPSVTGRAWPPCSPSWSPTRASTRRRAHPSRSAPGRTRRWCRSA